MWRLDGVLRSHRRGEMGACVGQPAIPAPTSPKAAARASWGQLWMRAKSYAKDFRGGFRASDIRRSAGYESIRAAGYGRGVRVRPAGAFSLPDRLLQEHGIPVEAIPAAASKASAFGASLPLTGPLSEAGWQRQRSPCSNPRQSLPQSRNRKCDIGAVTLEPAKRPGSARPGPAGAVRPSAAKSASR